MSLARREVADVRLAGEHRHPGRLRLRLVAGAPVGVQVVQHPGGRLAEQPVRAGERVGEVRRDRRGVAGPASKPSRRVAEPLLRLAHHGRAADPAERVEGHRRPVAVRVADQARRQHPVVVAVRGHRPSASRSPGGDQVAERVAGLRDEQVVAVVG